MLLQMNALQQTFQSAKSSICQRQQGLFSLQSALAQQPQPDIAVRRVARMRSSSAIQSVKVATEMTALNVESMPVRSVSASAPMLRRRSQPCPSNTDHKPGGIHGPVPPTSTPLAARTRTQASPACSVASKPSAPLLSKNSALNVEKVPAKSVSASVPILRQRSQPPWSITCHKAGNMRIPVPPTSTRLAALASRDASPACSVASTATTATARGRGRDPPRISTSTARHATYKREASWNTVIQKLHVHAAPRSSPSNSRSSSLHSGVSTPRVPSASPQGSRLSTRAETRSHVRHSLLANPRSCTVVGQPQANFPSDNPFKAVHQALLQARVISQDSRRSVGSNQWMTGTTTPGGAALKAIAVLQQIKKMKEENASLNKQINTATKMAGHLRQHSRSLMRQLEREVSRSQRLEEQLIDDYDMPQIETTRSVSTTQVGARACAAKVAAPGEASVGIKNVPACSPSPSTCDGKSLQKCLVD
mmetsp:Transcript_21575/g.41193  ORF Transcript_21575/g.41193 Transcript_21575/m.41193 type:complete len:478 (+) Transcript_21575:142-1575(+)